MNDDYISKFINDEEIPFHSNDHCEIDIISDPKNNMMSNYTPYDYGFNSNGTSTESYDQAFSSDSSESFDHRGSKGTSSTVLVNDKFIDKTAKVEKQGKIKKAEIEIKREAAKKRAKEKKKIDLSDIDQKYIPEGFYEADPKQQKKMLQMIRNRQSAQASRDKKKMEEQELKTRNSILEAELATMKKELAKAHQTIQRLSESNHCSTCQHLITSQQGPITDESEESELFSPISRASGRGLFSFSSTLFVMMGLIAVFAICFVGPVGFNQKESQFTPRNLMAIGHNPYPSKYLDGKYTLMHAMNREFEANYLEVYKASQADELMSNLIVDPKHNLTQNMIRRDPTDRDLRLTAQNIIIEDLEMAQKNATTLYCPVGVEFFSQIFSKSENVFTLNEQSNLKNAEYLQIIIPKSSLHFSFENENVSVPVPTEDENKYYEIFVKVYQLREFEMRA